MKNLSKMKNPTDDFGLWRKTREPYSGSSVQQVMRWADEKAGLAKKEC
ncbi:MAG: hypothetical protein U1C46_07305 [Bacteroidales bacterium]|nr:hypothetical protein [Bacteroidales bacterium]